VRLRTAIPKKVRDRVRNRFSGRCGYCGEISDRLQVDHVESFERTGNSDESNLMPACFACNNLKSAFGLEAFRREVAAQLSRAQMYSVNYRTALRFKQVVEVPRPIIFYFENEFLKAGNG
jgi:hypothetical protein